MASNRQDTEYEIWSEILVQANTLASTLSAPIDFPQWIPTHSTPNRNDTLLDKMQKILGVFHALAI